MRLAKYMLILLAVVLSGVALLISVGLYTNEPVFYVAAVWVTLFLAMALVVAMIRAYQRLVMGSRTTAERLSELTFLQERRYEQLSKRLDYTNDYLRLLKKLLQGSRNRGGSASSVAAIGFTHLEELNSRLQRAERRILGKLENDIYESQIRHTELQRELALLVQKNLDD